MVYFAVVTHTDHWMPLKQAHAIYMSGSGGWPGLVWVGGRAWVQGGIGIADCRYGNIFFTNIHEVQ